MNRAAGVPLRRRAEVVLVQGSAQPILVVDDEPLVASTLIELLSVHGYKASSVGSGEEALAALEAKRFDLVILDINLPGINGFDTCRAIRERFGAALPVIMLTALGDATALRQGYEAGADDFLHKPVDTPLLVLKVRAFLRFKALHDETVRHREEAHERARDMAALHGIGRDWSLIAEPHDFYRMVTDRLAVLIGAPVVGIAHYDSPRHRMAAALPVHGMDEAQAKELTYHVDPGDRTLALLANGRPYVSNRAQSDPRLFRDMAKKMGAQSVLVAPLVSAGEVLGLLVAANKPGGFDGADAQLFSIFAGPAATFLRSREIYKRQERHAARLARLSDIAGALAGTAGRQALLQLLCGRVQRDFGFSYVGFHAADEDGTRLEACAGAGALDLDPEVLRWAVKSSAPVRLSDSSRPAVLALPVVGVRPLGVLCVVRTEEGPFEDEEVSLLSTLAGQLSAALQKATSVAQTEALAQRMATLYDLGLETASVRDLRHLLQKATEEAGRLIKADHASVLRWDDGIRALRMFAPWMREGIDDTLTEPVFRLGEGIAGVVARDMVPIISNEPESHGAFVRRENTVSRLICVPLTHYDPELEATVLFGVLNASRGPGAAPFEKGDLEYLAHFASQISIAVANSLAFDAERERSDQLAFVNHLLREIAGSLSRVDILHTACERIQEAFGYHAVAIYWIDHDAGTCAPAAIASEGRSLVADLPGPHGLAVGAVGDALKQDRAIRVDDVREHPEEKGLLASTRSRLAVPIRSGGEIVAVLSAESDEPRRFERADVLMFETIADGVGIILRNAALYQDLGQTNEKLLRADRLKTEVVNLVAHDFRSPLAGILGFAELLADVPDVPREARVQHAQAIIEGVNYLAGLVEKTLKSTRLDSGQFPFHFDLLDLATTIRSVVARFPKDPQRAFSLTLPEGPLPVWGDEARLAEVVENLLSNAFKYTPPGGMVGLLAAAEGDLAVVRVQDTGVGLAAADLDRIFRPFTRVKNRRLPHVRGVGLGLAICQRIVRAHGGDLKVESVENEGSEFVFKVPLYGVAAQTRGPLLVLATADAPSRREIRAAADVLGLAIHEAADGVEVVEAARRLGPAAVFIDRLLPNLGAEDIAERLQLSADTSGMPLIVLADEGEMLADDRIFHAVFRKPVRAQDVESSLASLLAARGASG